MICNSFATPVCCSDGVSVFTFASETTKYEETFSPPFYNAAYTGRGYICVCTAKAQGR